MSHQADMQRRQLHDHVRLLISLSGQHLLRLPLHAHKDGRSNGDRARTLEAIAVRSDKVIALDSEWLEGCRKCCAERERKKGGLATRSDVSPCIESPSHQNWQYDVFQRTVRSSRVGSCRETLCGLDRWARAHQCARNQLLGAQDAIRHGPKLQIFQCVHVGEAGETYSHVN
jgi:hypothetical protein